MDRFLVHQKKAAAAATHAIVVGAGDYPHLVNGSQKLSDYHDGMGQLSSPPLSARAFAEWLINSYENPDRQLETVALLLAENPASTFTNPATGAQLNPERANYSNVAAAIQDWARRGAENPNNLLIFYFCGHGVAQGSDMSLLTAEYGADPLAPLDEALDFRKFRLAMSRNLPNQQIYFVDACRASSDSLIQSQGYAGRTPVQVGQQSAAETPIYFATLSGEDAFGKQGEVSFFTKALIKGLNGMGSDNPEGKWLVTTTRLKEAIDYEVKRAFEGGVKRRQVPPTDELSTFVIHRLKSQPEVPVTVTCEPDSHNQQAEFSYAYQGVEKDRRTPANESWSIMLPAGDYEFRAKLPQGIREPVEKPVHIRPIYRKVIIEV